MIIFRGKWLTSNQFSIRNDVLFRVLPCYPASFFVVPVSAIVIRITQIVLANAMPTCATVEGVRAPFARFRTERRSCNISRTFVRMVIYDAMARSTLPKMMKNIERFYCEWKMTTRINKGVKPEYKNQSWNLIKKCDFLLKLTLEIKCEHDILRDHPQITTIKFVALGLGKS